jgi:mannose/fructose/N-acetylgalactosamine-specific phosphotransferase system component IIB
LRESSSKRNSFSFKKRCNSKIIRLRYYQKEKTIRKTKEREKENETILKSFTSIRSFCKLIEKIVKNIKVIIHSIIAFLSKNKKGNI